MPKNLVFAGKVNQESDVRRIKSLQEEPEQVFGSLRIEPERRETYPNTVCSQLSESPIGAANADNELLEYVYDDVFIMRKIYSAFT